MPFHDLQEFVRHLEATRQLKRIRVEVDPVLEAGEISQRVLRDQGPALLFERPKGSATPLLMNLFGTMERIRSALGREPAEIGAELLTAVQRLNPPSLRGLWQSRHTLRRGLAMRPASARRALVQQVAEKPQLTDLPILQCWPEDAGRFITYGMVL